ncbi:MAG: hypothetical protein QNL33_07900 [Akkermansiaceae bacterium]
MKDGATVNGEFVVEFRLFVVNAALGDEKGAVRLDYQGSGVVAGLEGLLEGVGGIALVVDDGISVVIDEFGDLVAT